MREVKPGDRFTKIGDRGPVWVVSGPAPIRTNLPPHLSLIDEANPRRRITIAKSALLDSRLYQRAEPKALREEVTPAYLEIPDPPRR